MFVMKMFKDGMGWEKQKTNQAETYLYVYLFVYQTLT